MERGIVFRDFLEETGYKITYNGVRYTISDSSNNLIVQTNTDDEIYLYIIGYREAQNMNNNYIEDLKKQNLINIERYEKMIKDSSDKFGNI